MQTIDQKSVFAVRPIAADPQKPLRTHYHLLHNPKTQRKKQESLSSSSSMAASVNNLASAFSTLLKPSPPPPATSALAPSPATSALTPLSTPSITLSISASWNPHSSLPRHRRSSLLSLYGPAGPPPPATALRPTPIIPFSIAAGDPLPRSPLSYLAGTTVRTTSSGDLARGKKIVVLGVSGAFAPPSKFTAEEFVKGAGEMRRRGAEVVACVSVNDVFVMRAWGESIGAINDVMMLTDLDGGMARKMGLTADLSGGDEGFGVRSENYCLVADDGVVKAVFGEENDGVGIVDVIGAI